MAVEQHPRTFGQPGRSFAPLLDMAGDWKLVLGAAIDEEMENIRCRERSGRPLNSENFIKQLELDLDRLLKPGKPGPKGKAN